MANLKRYNTNAVGMSGNVSMFEFEHGEYVKFEDIKEFLPSTSSNSDYTKCSEKMRINEEFLTRDVGTKVPNRPHKYKYCINDSTYKGCVFNNIYYFIRHTHPVVLIFFFVETFIVLFGVYHLK